MTTFSEKSSNAGERGVRAIINRHPRWSVGVIALCLVAYLFFQYRPRPAHRAFYTVDDGQTTFTHDYVVPPFEYEGKEAVQAVLFNCEHGSGPFIGYLLRFDPDNKMRLEADLKNANRAKARGPADMSGAEVKKPGAGNWISNVDPRQAGKQIADAKHNEQSVGNFDFRTAAEIMNVKCPDGKMASPAGAD